MKKILMILSVVFSLGSCAVYNEIADYVYEDRLSGQNLYYEAWMDDCTDFKTTAALLRGKIVYEADSGSDTATGPEETLTRGYGDCEDWTILFMNCYYFGTGEKLGLALVDSKSVEDGGTIDHACIWYNGYTYNQYRGCLEEYDSVGFTYKFSEIF